MTFIQKQALWVSRDAEGNIVLHFPTSHVAYIEGAVGSVNGAVPDENKNVTIDVGVKKVNDVTPDADGNVAIEDYITGASINGKTITLNFKDGTSKTLTTQDTVPTDYVSNLSISGTTITATFKDGTTKTLTTQDTTTDPRLSKYPSWWLDRGTGADGAYSPTANATISGEKNYTTVNIPSGVTITVSPATLIKCQGAFVNKGTITAVGKGMTGGGGGSGSGSAGTRGYVSSGGASGTKSDGTGSTAGVSPATPCTTAIWRTDVKTSGNLAFTLGSGGSAGGCYYGSGTTTANGGAGGGGILIVAKTVTNTGTISANGGSGSAGNKNYNPGGGGGGGGTVIVVADSINDTGTITANGGAGGGVSNTKYANSGASGGTGLVYKKVVT